MSVPDAREQPPSIAFAAVPAPANIVSWLPGDGNTDDIVGTNDGTLVNGATYGTGKVGQAFLLNRVSSDHVNLGNDPSLHLSTGGAFSMEAWVKFNTTNDDMSILDKMHSPTNQDGWRLLKQRDQRIWFCLGGVTGNGCGASTHTVFSLTTVTSGIWYHVAAVVDATSFSLYLDGALQQTKSLPVYKDTNSSDLRLGLYATESFSHLDGLIDEATFYARALSGQEIQDIHDAGSDGKSQPSPNSPPAVASDTDPVVVDEGQTAQNTGTVSDPDGDAVALSASVGAVTNNSDGTWSWSFGTSDGPSESQAVTIDADDGNGGTAQTSFTLTVDNVAPIVTAVTVPGAPVAFGDQPISASGAFIDPAGTADEAYGCTVDYGDGSGAQGGTVAGTICTGPDQTYAEAGVYTVTVTVTDKDGDSGSLTAETMIIIYDPSGGFVTGGGWIDSPAGAYVPDPTLTGKANFGFVSKYKKGATVPTGNTEFQFKAGDLNFHSSSYDWLVITGSNYARFKGEGTINGAGVYKFMLWAGDADPDTFRIKITEVGGGIVYDNGMDQPIGGGSIVIHSK
jgi:hypothetical protein